MSATDLAAIAQAMVFGTPATDESNNVTLSSPGLDEDICGVILYDETVRSAAGLPTTAFLRSCFLADNHCHLDPRLRSPTTFEVSQSAFSLCASAKLEERYWYSEPIG